MKYKKVYCNQCKYLYERPYVLANRYMNDVLQKWRREELLECSHPNNIELLDTGIEQKETYKQSPQKINVNNDCKWFKKRWFGCWS